jgi:hypothetical protein
MRQPEPCGDTGCDPTGQSIPGAMIPSTCSAAASRSMPCSSSVEMIARRSAYGTRRAGSRSTAITYSRAPRRREQPELRGPGA